MKKYILNTTATLAFSFPVFACSSANGDARRVTQLQQEAKEYNRQQ